MQPKVVDGDGQLVIKVREHFPFRLYDMLEYASKYGHQSVISWSIDGRAFVIHQEEKLMEHLVPTFFKQTKVSSFVSPSLAGACANRAL
jgi:hypothetical protein